MDNITSPEQTVNKNKNMVTSPGVLPAQAGGHPEKSSSCLFSNNGTDSEKNTNQPSPVKLSSYEKKRAETLSSNVKRLVEFEAESMNHVAFLTLTFKKNIIDHAEARKHFRSFNSHFLSGHPVFGNWVSVKEHQVKRGKANGDVGTIHYHMIIALSEDIRTGFDFDQYDEWLKGPRKEGTFPTGNAQLRSLWAEMGSVLPDYGFGRIFTLEPLKAECPEQIGRYIGKYVSKQIGQQIESDKGQRMINYSRGWLRNSLKMAWNNEKSKSWREKVAIFARIHGCQELYQLSEKLGSDWAYKYTQEIVDLQNVPQVFHEEVFGKEKEFKSPTLESIKDHKQERENKLVKDLTLHSGKSAAEQKKEETKIKLGKISKKSIETWLTPESIEKVKSKIAAEREEAPFKETKRLQDQLQRSTQGGKEFPCQYIVKEGPITGEIIPF